MAFVASNSTADPRAQAVGTSKMQILTFTVGTGITSGTITASNLTSAETLLIDGVVLSSAPTFSGNVVTLAFADPGATIYGTAIVLGK